MKSRMNYYTTAPEAMKILIGQEEYLREQFKTSETLTVHLWELVKLRVSQMNQCAYCVNLHSKDALEQGESVERLIGLSAWREMPFYDQVESIALDMAEVLTLGQSLEDDKYSQAVEVLGDKAVVDLVVAINAINSWNRIAKTFKPQIAKK
ncbi:carboxymuconolactone decarboxylase family protein [Vibrio sp. Isolate25]|uniref:carboxymuconolactone decarboxylase family protein n=1 Tax=Vibrio sp. Isolate25 TaxID=2908535 RepID=UPI001EFD7722|nr:carboxymuconolactone decarboxylase family protein [Vibrio sp. Isolate25]MCG9595528.1 carboxymuconolactone decarboxylase family protein [Vibrio sp. Isolate25]